MNKDFGQIAWNCWKNKKPDKDKNIYAYRPWISDDIDISIADDFQFKDTDYWAYVFMPDPPVIDRKNDVSIDDLTKVIYTLQEKVKSIQNLHIENNNLQVRFNVLRDRLEDIEKHPAHLDVLEYGFKKMQSEMEYMKHQIEQILKYTLNK